VLVTLGENIFRALLESWDSSIVRGSRWGSLSRVQTEPARGPDKIPRGMRIHCTLRRRRDGWRARYGCELAGGQSEVSGASNRL